MSFLASYTWSKNIDNGPAPFNLGKNLNRNNQPQDPFNLGAEVAGADTDVTHNLVVSGIYELPFGRGKRFFAAWHGARQAFLGGWQLNTIFVSRTGLPVNRDRGKSPDPPVCRKVPVLNRVRSWRRGRAPSPPRRESPNSRGLTEAGVRPPMAGPWATGPERSERLPWAGTVTNSTHDSGPCRWLALPASGLVPGNARSGFPAGTGPVPPRCHSAMAPEFAIPSPVGDWGSSIWVRHRSLGRRGALCYSVSIRFRENLSGRKLDV
jgi:hypothetical protein